MFFSLILSTLYGIKNSKYYTVIDIATLFKVWTTRFRQLDFPSSQQHAYWLRTCRVCLKQIWCSARTLKDGCILTRL